MTLYIVSCGRTCNPKKDKRIIKKGILMHFFIAEIYALRF